MHFARFTRGLLVRADRRAAAATPAAWHREGSASRVAGRLRQPRRRATGSRGRATGARAPTRRRPTASKALPFFIGAVIIAHQLGAAQARLDILAAAVRYAAHHLHRDVRRGPAAPRAARSGHSRSLVNIGDLVRRLR